MNNEVSTEKVVKTVHHEVAYAIYPDKPNFVSVAKLFGHGAHELTSLSFRCTSHRPFRVLVLHTGCGKVPPKKDDDSVTQTLETCPFSSTISLSPPSNDYIVMYDSCAKESPECYYCVDLKQFRAKIKTVTDDDGVQYTDGDIIIWLCSPPFPDSEDQVQMVYVDLCANAAIGWSMVKEGKIAHIPLRWNEGNQYSALKKRLPGSPKGSEHKKPAQKKSYAKKQERASTGKKRPRS